MWIRRLAARVNALAYAPDGGTLYTLEGGRLRAWDIASRAPTQLARLDHVSNSNTRAMDFVGGRYLLIRTSGVLVWDLREGRMLPPDAIRGSGTPVNPHSTELRFISKSGELVRSCDLLTGKARTLVRKVRGMSALRLFAFTPDDRKAVLMDDQYRKVLVTVADGKAVEFTPPPFLCVYDVRFSQNGSALVWVSAQSIHARDVADLGGPGVSISCQPHFLALHPTAPICVTIHRNCRPTLFSLRTGEVIRTFDLNLGRWMMQVAFSPDGLTCAVAGTAGFAVFDVDL
jgi:WD40 repeat protein